MVGSDCSADRGERKSFSSNLQHFFLLILSNNSASYLTAEKYYFTESGENFSIFLSSYSPTLLSVYTHKSSISSFTADAGSFFLWWLWVCAFQIPNCTGPQMDWWSRALRSEIQEHIHTEATLPTGSTEKWRKTEGLLSRHSPGVHGIPLKVLSGLKTSHWLSGTSSDSLQF